MKLKDVDVACIAIVGFEKKRFMSARRYMCVLRPSLFKCGP
jgi:hypothetical protein